MRALVTGITGFVGGHLAELLLTHGDIVSGCSRSGRWPDPVNHLADRIRLRQCDLTNRPVPTTLLGQEPIDVVFHLAGLANPRACQNDPLKARGENVEATRNLYEAVRLSGQRPRVLFVSTAYVYGNAATEHLPIQPTCPLRTEHPYAATKWEAEQLSVRYADELGLNIIRVRPFNHIGPRQPTGYIVSDWAQQIAAIEAGKALPRLRVGNLDTRRDYADVRDVVRAYRMLACEPKAKGVYNLGSGVSRSGREILELLRRLSRVPWQFEIDQDRTRGSEAPEIVADATPLRTLVGWKPEIAFETTLRDTLDFWRHLQGGTS